MNFFILYLHIEGLPSADGGDHGVSGNDLYVQRAGADFSRVLRIQVAQKLPVARAGGIIPVIPPGPLHCGEQ